METIKILDYRDKEHFIQNVVYWSYINKEFRIRVTLNTIIPRTLKYDLLGFLGETMLISINIGNINRLQVI